jgi:hypothetical protein
LLVLYKYGRGIGSLSLFRLQCHHDLSAQHLNTHSADMECAEDFLSLPAWGHCDDMPEDVRRTMGLVGLGYLYVLPL